MEVRLAEFYTDPVRVNGSDLSLSDWQTRARALHAAAFSDLRSETLQVVADNGEPCRSHLSCMAGTLGRTRRARTIPPTGSDVQIRTIDLLHDQRRQDLDRLGERR